MNRNTHVFSCMVGITVFEQYLKGEEAISSVASIFHALDGQHVHYTAS